MDSWFGSCWLFLVVVGCCWLLLVVVGRGGCCCRCCGCGCGCGCCGCGCCGGGGGGGGGGGVFFLSLFLFLFLVIFLFLFLFAFCFFCLCFFCFCDLFLRSVYWFCFVSVWLFNFPKWYHAIVFFLPLFRQHHWKTFSTWHRPPTDWKSKRPAQQLTSGHKAKLGSASAGCEIQRALCRDRDKPWTKYALVFTRQSLSEINLVSSFLLKVVPGEAFVIPENFLAKSRPFRKKITPSHRPAEAPNEACQQKAGWKPLQQRLPTA